MNYNYLKNNFQNQFHLYNCISYFKNENEKNNWKQGKKRIDSTVLKQYMPKPGNDSIILICGPPSMMESLQQVMLPQLGYDKTHILEF